jgi:hypothetical protein
MIAVLWDMRGGADFANAGDSYLTGQEKGEGSMARVRQAVLLTTVSTGIREPFACRTRESVR